ncbi:MAG: response regulator, partial [Deltaproteobacteria bacterium]|nr:response regulator [Deltaproteobacteria bacterium]
ASCRGCLMRIMIMEDDPISRRLLETFLGQWGYDVLVTKDGGEAWKIIKESRVPGLIIQKGPSVSGC